MLKDTYNLPLGLLFRKLVTIQHHLGLIFKL